MRHLAVYGQALAEYCLIGVLICVGSILALGAFSDQLSLNFGSFKTALIPNSSNALNNNSATSSFSGQQSSTSNELVSNPVPNLPVNLEDVQQLLNTNATSLVETAGSSGYTNMLASGIQIIANQLQENKQVSPAEITELVDLAQKGYRISQIEYLLEKAFYEANKDPNVFANIPISFEGKTYSTKDFSQMIDYTGATANNDYLKFTKAADSIKNSTNIPSNVQSLISQLASAIKTRTADAHSDFYFSALGNIRPNISVGAFSNPTNKDATQICTTGNGSTDGVSCN